MNDTAIGERSPDFQVQTTQSKTTDLNDYAGRNLVLYFYPKDNTPGCTTEGQDFRDHYDQFQALETEILGVSRDSLASHEKFRTKQLFPFALAADTESRLCQTFDVLKEKTMYGRKVMGIERSTFLIDRNGVLRREWRKVKVKDHVDDVLEAVRAL